MTSITEMLCMPTPTVAESRRALLFSAEHTEIGVDGRPVDRARAVAELFEYAPRVTGKDAMNAFIELVHLVLDYRELRTPNPDRDLLDGEVMEKRGVEEAICDARQRHERLIHDVLEQLVPPVAVYTGPVDGLGRPTPTHHLNEVPA